MYNKTNHQFYIETSLRLSIYFFLFGFFHCERSKKKLRNFISFWADDKCAYDDASTRSLLT